MPIEPPFGIIHHRLKLGKVVPFLGAGASLVGRAAAPGGPWDPRSSPFLPTGGELSEFLADEANFPSKDRRDRDDLGKVSSYYADVSGRRALRERLRDLLGRDYSPGPLHRYLAAIPGPQVIVVTNYDTLMEQAFNEAGKPYDLLVYPADRKDYGSAILWWPHGAAEPLFKAANELDRHIDLTKTTVVFKMHGTIGVKDQSWDNFVITEEDYVEFLSRMTANTAVPSLFFQHFRERSFLFLGYSLRDWNLRVVLRNLSRHLASRNRGGAGGSAEEDPMTSWAIQKEPAELERRLWEKRGVEIYDLTLEEFVNHMRSRGERVME